MLTVGSLFAGIGGFDLGFERAGMRTLWQVEQSEFCRRVLERHFPNAERFEDVRDVGANELAPVDLICGGFPCQDISSANPNAVGIAGTRSGLWSEYARLVGELRPRYVVVENVSILTSRGLGVVLGDLAALGYDAEWDCIPASAIGAPHRRDRIWIVAYPGSLEHEGTGHAECGQTASGLPEADPHPNSGRLEVGVERNGRTIGPRQRASLGRDADGFRDDVANASRDAEAGPAPEAGTIGQRARPGGQHRGARGVGDSDGAPQDAHASSGSPWPATGERGWWSVEPDVGRVAHGIPARVDRLAALGNALVPQIAEWIGRRIIEWEGGLA